MMNVCEEFRKAYHPTPEERQEQIELSKRIDEQAVREKWCCTCRHNVLKNGWQPGGRYTYDICLRGRETGKSCELYELRKDDQT